MNNFSETFFNYSMYGQVIGFSDYLHTNESLIDFDNGVLIDSTNGTERNGLLVLSTRALYFKQLKGNDPENFDYQEFPYDLEIFPFSDYFTQSLDSRILLEATLRYAVFGWSSIFVKSEYNKTNLSNLVNNGVLDFTKKLNDKSTLIEEISTNKSFIKNFEKIFNVMSENDELISDNITNSKKYMSSTELTNDKIGKWSDIEKKFTS